METISIRGLAAIIGVDDKLLRRAIADGKIGKKSYRINKGNGRPELYKVRALQDCRDHGIGMKKGVIIEESLIEEHTKKKPAPKVEPPVVPDTPLPPREDKPRKPSIAEAKNDREIIRMKMDALTLAERQGTLVPKQKVYDELFELGNEIKTKMQGIPDKYLDLIMNASDRSEAHLILSGAIIEALESLSSNQIKI